MRLPQGRQTPNEPGRRCWRCRQRARATVLASPSPIPVAWLRAPAKSQTVGKKKTLRGSGRLAMLAAELPVRCHTCCFGCHIHRQNSLMPVTTACSSRCGRTEIGRQTARVAYKQRSCIVPLRVGRCCSTQVAVPVGGDDWKRLIVVHGNQQMLTGAHGRSPASRRRFMSRQTSGRSRILSQI